MAKRAWRTRGSAVTPLRPAWDGPQLAAATASSLDGSESPGACEDAGLDYCQVTVTGPVSFNLRP